MSRSTALSTPGITPEVLRALRQMGREFTPETVVAVTQLLTPLHRAAGYQAPNVVGDLHYGPDPRHRLDVHSDGGASTDQKPVLVFVHGGGLSAETNPRRESCTTTTSGRGPWRRGWSRSR